METLKLLWRELHRTDLGDDEHYPNGFRKFSCFDPVTYIRLALSIVALILSVIVALR